MTSEKLNEMEDALLEFVKRAASKEATAEEVESLPAVAKVLAAMNYRG